MNSATDPLLEALALVHPFGYRISELYENLDAMDVDVPSDKTFYRARDELLEHGYIEPIDADHDDIFRITPSGLDYLEGEIRGLDLDIDEE